MNTIPPPLPRIPPSPTRRVAAAPPKPLPPLDLRLLGDLPSLDLQARYLVEGFLAGRHRSPQKGSSVEFAEYRDYQPGDDLRRVDWRLFGRTDRLHVKQYEEETQLRVFVVLDTSASMDFQSRPDLLRKLEFARIAVAGIAALAHRQGDAFGLGLAGSNLSEFLRARSSVPHWRTFIGRLQTVVHGGKTSLATALEELAEVVPARSLLVIASDFYEEPKALETALGRLRYDHHDVIGLHVLDPVEVDFDFESSGTFVDMEDGRQLKLDAPAARRGYLERFQRFAAELDELFHGIGGEFTRLRTDQPPLAALAGYVAQREQRLK